MKSKDTLTRLIEQIPEVIGVSILLADSRGGILYANSAAQEALLISDTNLRRMKIQELFSGIENFQKYVDKCLKGKRVIIFDPYISNHKDLHLPLSLVELDLIEPPDGGSQFLTVSFKKKEGSLVEKILEVQENRDDLFDTVWKGISHEIKNPLGGIRGAAQMLIRGLDDDSPFQHHGEVILREADRINRFIDSLSFHEKSGHLEKLDLLEILTENLDLIRSHIANTGKKIETRFIADTSLPPLSGDRDALFRAFMNILKNSEEAIGKEGLIQITLKLHEDFILRTEGNTKNFIIEIDFFDTGREIPESVIPRIFLPFFTDKTGGTGMGLFFVKHTVKCHGGSIKVKTLPVGKAFKIYFPLNREGV